MTSWDENVLVCLADIKYCFYNYFEKDVFLILMLDPVFLVSV